MKIGLNLTPIAMKARNTGIIPLSSRYDGELNMILDPLTKDKKAKIPPLSLMKNINPNSSNVFDTFTKIDDVTQEINFVKKPKEWTDCLLEEIVEFTVAKEEYEADKTEQNFDHMEEEMGDIFFTAASIAKDAGINPMEAFRATNRKFYNRINLMEHICASQKNQPPVSLGECEDYQRRALWNYAKRKLYDAQALNYQA